MREFINALVKQNGATFLSDYEKYRDLSTDDIRRIAIELIYAIECSNDILEIDKKNIFENCAESLTDYIYD